MATFSSTSPGRGLVARFLQEIISTEKIQLAVANAENSAGGFGITPLIAQELFSIGLDLLTSGNHIWDKKEIFDYIGREPRSCFGRRIIREELPGKGWIATRAPATAPKSPSSIYKAGSICRPLTARSEKPTTFCNRSIRKSKSGSSIFTPNSPAREEAMGWHLNGRVSAVLGTHTHVPTADERILSGGTAYQTDVGMTGPYDSVIGSDKNLALRRFLTGMPIRLESAKTGAELHATIVSVDPATGHAQEIRRYTRS